MNQSQPPFNSKPPRCAPLQLIGITGGIGSGKSYICKQLEAAGHTVFYCDDEAKRIIRTDPEVQAQLKALVGDDLYDAQGALVKPRLAAYLCQGEAYAHRVDSIVHPKVAQAFQQRAEAMRAALLAQADSHAAAATDAETALRTTSSAAGATAIRVEALIQLPRSRTLFMECALLFEAHFDTFVDHSLLVHVSPATQLQRLMQRDHISADKAREWIALQWSEEAKMQHADFYIDNEATRNPMQSEIFI